MHTWPPRKENNFMLIIHHSRLNESWIAQEGRRLQGSFLTWKWNIQLSSIFAYIHPK